MWGVGGVVLCVAFEEAMLVFLLVTVRSSSLADLVATRFAASCRLISGKLNRVGDPRGTGPVGMPPFR
jgi:hypothetical protein